MTLQTAVETYNQTKNYSQPEEYPVWVTEIDNCLMLNRRPKSWFAPWVHELHDFIKVNQTISQADETK